MTADTESPGVVARRLFRALADERWVDAVALVDPAVVLSPRVRNDPPRLLFRKLDAKVQETLTGTDVSTLRRI